MTSHTIVGAKPALFVTRFRGRLALAIHDEDDIVAGWVTSYLTGTVLLWDAKLNQHQVLFQYVMN